MEIMNIGTIRRKLKTMGFKSKQINNIISTMLLNPPEKELTTTDDIIYYLENS